jgi:hypothetical protein
MSFRGLQFPQHLYRDPHRRCPGPEPAARETPLHHGHSANHDRPRFRRPHLPAMHANSDAVGPVHTQRQVLAAGGVQRLQLPCQRVHDANGHCAGCCPNLCGPEAADALLNQVGCLYHDGLDAAECNCDGCEGDVFTFVYGPDRSS